MKKLSLIFFLIYGITSSQNLEETIYKAAETFISDTNNASLELLEQQEAIFKTQIKTKDEQLALVFLQCNKGYYLNTHSKLHKAISAYEAASKRFDTHALSKLSDFDIIESCLKPLGNLYTKTNNYTNAVNIINQYIFLAEKNKNINHQIGGAINLVKLYQTIGNHKTALNIIKKVNNLPHINRTKKEHLLKLKVISLAALKQFKAATLINNSIVSSAFHTYKNKYIIELQKGNHKNARLAFQKAKLHLAEANLSTRKLAVFYVEEAQLYHILKTPDSASKSLQRAIKALLPNFNNKGLPNKTDLYPENTFIDIFDLYAKVQSNTDVALKSFDLSFYVSNLLQHSWTSQETKIINETNNRNRSEICIDLLFKTYNKTKNKIFLFQAFQYSEHYKSSILKDLFNKRTRLRHFPKDSLLIKELRLLQEQERITNSLIKERLNTNYTSQINHLSKQLSDISIQIKTLQTTIKTKYPKANNTHFSLETVQKKIAKDHAILMEYFYGKNTIYQFIISNKDIQLNAIPLSKDTKQSIINFIHLFNNASSINNDIGNFTFQAFNLFKLLKLNTIATSKHVVLIPDGLLNFIPFEALLSSKTKTTAFSKMPFLVKEHTIAYNSSLLFYLKGSQKNNNNRLLGFFPVFENTNQTLSYSINEANAIKEKMPSTVFMNANASKENFIKHLVNYDILHLSTHASSGNFTKPANITFYDDTMFLNELYSLNLKSNLVVLSACETGIGKLNKGAGAMSIARGFQYAGAENLLFSLWQINDLSTSEIMQSFYQNYSKNQSAFVANHNSKIEYLNNDTISNIKKSPYFWSAFVYYGSLEKAKSKKSTLYITFGVLIILIVLLLILKLKKYDRDTSRIST